jgi:hypothetical protein
MKGFQRAVGCLLAVGFLGQMPTPVIAAETPTVIEMPYASSLTAKDGSIRVVLQDSRKVHVTIQKMTQEGSDAYYDVVLDPTQSGAATTEYVFYLDCCEYNLSTASYVSTYQLTIADESTPEAVYTESDIAIFDPHFSDIVNTTCYRYAVTMLEGTMGGVVATVPKESISNGVRTVENQVTLRYVPQTTGVTGSTTTTATTTTTTMLTTSTTSKTTATTTTMPIATTSALTTTTTEPAFKLGDVDGNGMIEVADAVLVLTYYAKSAAGIAVTIDSRLADVNGDSIVDVADAVGILTYYAKQAAGLPPTF